MVDMLQLKQIINLWRASLRNTYPAHLPRIARMMLHIEKYDVDIKYVPGKKIPLADVLSRLNPCNADTIKGLAVSINELHMHLNASPTRVKQIQILSSLKSFISHGWPDKRADCPSHLHGYWNYRDELTVGQWFNSQRNPYYYTEKFTTRSPRAASLSTSRRRKMQTSS